MKSEAGKPMFIHYLKGIAEGAALTSEDSSFEVVHLKDVEKHMTKLAHSRGLSTEICLIIGYGHDLGRTHLGVEGKKHARAGSEFMEKLLQNTEFTAMDRYMICKAIKRHNQKSKIHGVYDEVIKDADSLAHQDEGLIGEQDITESYRARIAMCKGIEFQVAPTEKWQAEALQCLRQIEEMIKDETLYLNSPDQWVHSIRVTVRKMRSIIGLIESVQKKSVTKRLRQFDNGLKEISKTLAETRFLQIACIKIGEANPLHKELNDRLLQCYRTLENKNILLDHIEPTALYISMLSEMQYEPACMEKQVYKLITNYIKKADEVSLDNAKELHQLRIQGKKIKYLCQLELVAIEPEIFVNAVSSLHRLIGKYHDIVEIHLLLKASPFKNELELLKKEIWAECFLLKLIKTNFLDK